MRRLTFGLYHELHTYASVKIAKKTDKKAKMSSMLQNQLDASRGRI